MKKQLKKLSLSKETLRNLSGHELKGVVGGVTMGCCNSSDISETCPSCRCTAACQPTWDC
jgi:acid phosphatase family membrane protein YuiD